MSKRGGFQGGMPGNMNNLMKQAQRMQRQMEEQQKAMEEKQQELEAKEFSAKAGGGAVEAIVTGAKELKGITISKDVVDPDDVEMLQDLIVASINEAMKQVDEEIAKLAEANNSALGNMTGGLGGFGF